MISNLNISTNLMIDDDEHEPKERYLPGDYVGQVYPELKDPAIKRKRLTEKQIVEDEQYLICMICKRPCAGTCEESKIF